MASERDIKRRIKTVRNTQQITKAMKMVAAARIKKAEDRFKSARPYSLKLQEVMRQLIQEASDAVHPLMQVRPVRRTGILVVTSDKGLCGAYNNSLLKMVLPYLNKISREDFDLVLVGGKGEKFLRRRKFNPHTAITGWTPDIDTANKVSDILRDWYVSEQVDRVVCFYTQAVSAATQKPVMEVLLPLSTESKEGEEKTGVSYTFEPSAQAVLDLLLPRYLNNTIYRILLESRVSELSARLKSMSNATDNANKLAQELTLQYFRVRQDNITREILEISGGAEALKASK
jgi:F-type H+-transporting ATPase subunit gamma